ncbi:MAG: Kiwa anti-phage protein KwaB-like domain-containing protein [Bacilli bacterium]
MFDNSSIMVLLNDGNENPVQLLEVDKPTQMAICSSFAEAAVPLLSGKQIVTFNGNYKPNEDEVLSICNFHLPEIISDAIRNPLGLQTFSYDKDAEPDIRAVFVGERTEADNTEIFTVAFQRFRKEQYLSTKKFSLFFEENTFKRETRWGIGITDTIDCVLIQNELRFSSYYYARQIFDLSEHYRSATDAEVQSFSELELLSIVDKDQFQSMADTWIRSKIAVINDSGVLKNNKASKIKRLAKNCGLEITVENEKIVIPADKKKLKGILGFLDEEVYKGVFTEDTYITNSKRKMQ